MKRHGDGLAAMSRRPPGIEPRLRKRPSRVLIEGIEPEVDGGRTPIKRVAGERLVVRADIFTDGHDLLRAELLVRHADAGEWTAAPMRPLGNDRWEGTASLSVLGVYRYTITGWIDPLATWIQQMKARVSAASNGAGQDLAIEWRVGADLIAAVARRADAGDVAALRAAAKTLARGEDDARRALLDDAALKEMADRYAGRHEWVQHEPALSVIVERQRALVGAWYELFPRSAGSQPGRHGTLRDCEERLPYIARLGFDIVYLPPIHPIGQTHRKGPNNARAAGSDDPGSPWAIGSEVGGHDAMHPQLGSLEDFRRLIGRARDYGMEIAMDLAFQCSPDHPYVRQHPAWFHRRPDGSIRFAENPPKRYEDVYPLDFESPDWWALWQELKRVVEFWIGQGVRIFRVDNPHTKPLRFWEWLIGEIRASRPEVIWLSEAFTRPRVMQRLAKLGFSQSYTYFTWRHTAAELRDYFTELTAPPIADYFRPNVWPNTPDILATDLQAGGRPAFIARLVLAATLSASYGIYGPAFEVGESIPREPGSEEYRDAEKYQLRVWDWDRGDSLAPVIARVNAIRRANAALHANRSLVFHATGNDQLLAYSKRSEDGRNAIVSVVNLDPRHTQGGVLRLPLDRFGIAADQPYLMEDLLSGARYRWQGADNAVELDPGVCPAHVFRVRRWLAREQDFDYYL